MVRYNIVSDMNEVIIGIKKMGCRLVVAMQLHKNKTIY